MPNMGNILPDMGNRQSPRVSEAAALYARANLSDALFTQTQQRVLGHLFGQPGRQSTVSELIQATGAGSGAVQRELARLAGSGLLRVEKSGNQKRYSANPGSPIHEELVAIVRKTFGLAEPLKEALAPLCSQLDLAFIYGSVARGEDTSDSDIDLLLVSETLGYADVMAALHPAIERLGRQVNPTIYTRDELARRIRDGNAFVTKLLAQPKLWLIGGEHDLGA
jgi:predicted nucleotidyltransferase|tara:strand:- start:695 stop:1363 length:669 start_codon:yes stop_codon:yes gene_type:complete